LIDLISHRSYRFTDICDLFKRKDLINKLSILLEGKGNKIGFAKLECKFHQISLLIHFLLPEINIPKNKNFAFILLILKK
jgi:hypothetical protein